MISCSLRSEELRAQMVVANGVFLSDFTRTLFERSMLKSRRQHLGWEIQLQKQKNAIPIATPILPCDTKVNDHITVTRYLTKISNLLNSSGVIFMALSICSSCQSHVRYVSYSSSEIDLCVYCYASISVLLEHYPIYYPIRYNARRST